MSVTKVIEKLVVKKNTCYSLPTPGIKKERFFSLTFENRQETMMGWNSRKKKNILEIFKILTPQVTPTISGESWKGEMNTNLLNTHTQHS